MQQARANMYRTISTNIRTGDCLDILKEYPDDVFDLIVTSPPYVDSRSNTYGAINWNRLIKFNSGNK